MERAQDAAREIDALRRNLQREHLKRVQAAARARRSAAAGRTEPGALPGHRAAGVAAPRRRGRGLSIESRAHLQDSLGLLTGGALKASMTQT